MRRPGRRSLFAFATPVAALAIATTAHAGVEDAAWRGDLRTPRAPAVASQFTDRLVGGGVECYGRVATIVGSDGPDEIVGTSGRDVIAGLMGDDTIDGAGGHDFICPGDGSDTVTGGRGADEIEASDGDDVLDGGPGRDFIGFFGAPGAVRVNLAGGMASGWGTDTLQGFEGVVGSPFADRITGSKAENQLEGRAGDDVLNGYGGFDLLLPGAGRDRLNGGPGFDYAVYWDSPVAIWANLEKGRSRGNGPDRFESIHGLGGSERGDTLIGTRRGNGLYGHGGRDTLRGKGGRDWLYGGPGDDYLDGGGGFDFLHGERGRDRCVNGERVRSCP